MEKVIQRKWRETAGKRSNLLRGGLLVEKQKDSIGQPHVEKRSGKKWTESIGD